MSPRTERPAPVPRFSVVIPTHDRADRVIRAVESALAQTVDDREVIVVDDGSTDDTQARLRPYAERIRVFRQPNGGPAAAKNRGIREARGQIVGFLDSDDRWLPETLAEVAAEFDARPQAGLVSIRAREIGPDGKLGQRTYGKRSTGSRYTTRSLLVADSGGCSWFFVRRPLLERVGGFDESLRSAEECDLVLRLSFETELHALARPLLIRARHEGNLSADVALNARSWIRVLEKLAAEHPDFVERHPRAYRRSLAKERLRLGRELLAGADDGQAGLVEARQELATSLGLRASRRAATYLLWSWVAPRSYGPWRRRERARRFRS